MTRPHCAAAPLSPSSSFSCVSSSTSSCYVAPSWLPKRGSKKKRGERKGRAKGRAGGGVAVPRRNSSIYRGVTRHKGSGKYEAHLWDRHAWSPTTNRKGRQVYLGSFDTEELAAHTYDLAALKYWGSECELNFPLESYKQEREEMQRMTREVYLGTLRRRSSCFSRGVSVYRGVARHHYNGRWEARISKACGKKYIYLGTFGTQEEAARAYDVAALELRGHAAITNFDISSYADYPQQPTGPSPVPGAEPKPALGPKAEPVDEAPLLAEPCPVPPPLLLQPKAEPEDDEAPPPPGTGPVLRDAGDADDAIAEILRALGMDPADFEARYPARQSRDKLGWPADDLLPLPDAAGLAFEDDIETLFDEHEAPGAAGPGGAQVQLHLPAAAAVVPDASRADAVSFAAATISSLASGRWW